MGQLQTHKHQSFQKDERLVSDVWPTHDLDLVKTQFRTINPVYKIRIQDTKDTCLILDPGVWMAKGK
jgi:hypothetical protein